MTEQEISDWEREINHAQMMWRLAYKHEVNKRNEQMARSEAQANMAMASTVEQDRLAAKQLAAAEANEAARQRKRDINAQFWHSIKSVVFVISCAAIAVYTLIHFAGKA
ncbi:hypothetical protein PSYG_00021 [Psychrobacter phage pOW20-A]|uniref:hypothetical protein n=1 Tax=Psychrobacter phage pOW20-A TaxID=754048 RepID=UPI0002C1811F|nr:hypothetical protein PSYG_00021 [Psychrobacter phage pOW20-A]AGH57482.1 hypothetical protein PSYG_00021 [Psychrobacter phage pOW20-A]